MRAALVGLCLSRATAFTATPLGSFACRGGLTAGPGFLSLDAETLVVSRFTGDPLEADGVAVVRGLGALLRAGNVSGAACAPLAAVGWPNDVEPVELPLGAGGAGGALGALLAPGGFLVPPKTIGAVSVINWTAAAGGDARVIALSAPKVLPGDGWFYHRAAVRDVDGDGLADVIAARATKPLAAAPAGELVWFKQPAAAPLAPASLPWAAATLAAGAWSPDVLVSPPASLRADADEQIFAASFFTGGGLVMVE